MIAPSPLITNLRLSAVFGSMGAMLGTGVFSTDILTAPDAFERLGTAGLLVIAAALMLRYFMAKLDEKDKLNESLHASHAASIQESNKALVEELHSQGEIRQAHTNALAMLTQEIHNSRCSYDGPERRRGGT